jgi:hypothetical protein
MSDRTTETVEQIDHRGAAVDEAAQTLFEKEQPAGLTVALQGRLLVLAAFAIWFGLTRRPPTVFYMEALVLLFAVSGGAQLLIVRRFGVKNRPLYLLLFLEVSVLVLGMIIFAARQRFIFWRGVGLA